jgi:hypothetical protein
MSWRTAACLTHRYLINSLFWWPALSYKVEWNEETLMRRLGKQCLNLVETCFEQRHCFFNGQNRGESGAHCGFITHSIPVHSIKYQSHVHHFKYTTPKLDLSSHFWWMLVLKLEAWAFQVQRTSKFLATGHLDSIDCSTLGRFWKHQHAQAAVRFGVDPKQWDFCHRSLHVRTCSRLLFSKSIPSSDPLRSFEIDNKISK